MIKQSFLSILLLIFFTLFNNIFSQENDSLQHYNLDEVIVKSGFVIQPKTITEISPKSIKNSDANSLIELGKFIPSVKIQTNSRGESLFYIRDAGERQIALYFDGVPMNIPWDNRLDLSLIPTNAISEISVSKGVASIVYGANSIAGIINIDPLLSLNNNKKGNVELQFGDNSSKKISAFYLGNIDKLSYMFSAGYNKTDGYSLSNSYSNPDNPDDLRINSDKKGFNIFAKGNYKFTNFSDLSLSLSYIDAEKGVAPETDVSKPRFWRYPKWKKLLLSVNGKNQIGKNNRTLLTYTLAYTKFNMQINQYSDITYSKISENEKNDDHILYGRVNFSRMFGESSLVKISASGYNTKHYENISAFDDGVETADPENLYEQNVYSIGGEYEFLGNNFNVLVGGGLDGVNTVEAGDKENPGNTTDYTLNAALGYRFNDNYSAQLNIGRKTRFPTMREAFSGALGRFEVNPDLRAESAISSELSFKYKKTAWETDLSFFLTNMKDGIVRTTMPNGKFKRVNKDKIRTYGIEVISKHILSNDLSLNINMTYMNSFAQNSNGEYKDTLEYRPEVIAGAVLDYQIIEKTDLAIELNYVGLEYGLQQGSDAFQELPEYIIANARLSYNFNTSENVNFELFLRANNIFDKLYYTQWGLPEAGTQFFGGIKLSL